MKHRDALQTRYGKRNVCIDAEDSPLVPGMFTDTKKVLSCAVPNLKCVDVRLYSVGRTGYPCDARCV